MGYLWMIISCFFYALMGVLVKAASDTFTSSQLVAARGLFAIIVIGLWAFFTHNTLKTQQLKAHLSRSVFGTVSLLCWFIAIGLIPISTAMTLGNATPICMAFIVIAADFIKHRQTNWTLVFSAIVGFAGVATIFRPQLNTDLTGLLFAVASSLITALSYIQIRALAQLKEPVWRVVFYFSVLNLAFGLGLAPLDFGEALFNVTAIDWILVTGIGLCGLIAQLAVTKAFANTNLLASTILSFSVIVFGLVFGFLCFDDPIDAFSLLGTAAIIVSGVYSTMSVRRRQDESGL